MYEILLDSHLILQTACDLLEVSFLKVVEVVLLSRAALVNARKCWLLSMRVSCAPTTVILPNLSSMMLTLAPVPPAGR